MSTTCPHCGRDLPDLAGPGIAGKQPTSRAAAAIDRFTDRHWVLWVMRFGNAENADAITASLRDRWPANQTGARLLELRQAGYVEYAKDFYGKRRKGPTRSGRQGYLQRITPAGLALVGKLGDPREREVAGR